MPHKFEYSFDVEGHTVVKPVKIDSDWKGPEHCIGYCPNCPDCDTCPESTK